MFFFCSKAAEYQEMVSQLCKKCSKKDPGQRWPFTCWLVLEYCSVCFVYYLTSFIESIGTNGNTVFFVIIFFALIVSLALWVMFLKRYLLLVIFVRFIKMSSPKFNNITVVGCLLSYTEVFLSAYSNSSSAEYNTSLCYVRILRFSLF